MLNACWITIPDAPEKGCLVFYARKRWRLDIVPQSARLLISADCRYRLYLNGSLVGRGPVRGSATLQYFDEYDVAKFLRPGENELFTEVYSQREQNFVMHSLVPALIVELPEVLASDATWKVQKASGWHHEVPHYTMQSGFMEFRDLRCGADEDQWRDAVVVDCPELIRKQLIRNPLGPFPETSSAPVSGLALYGVEHALPEDSRRIPDYLGEEPHHSLPATQIENLGMLFCPEGECTLLPGQYGIGLILDFSAEISGRVEIVLDAPAGSTLQIVYGEELTGDRIATKFAADYHFTDCFILKEGENQVTTAFAERGFRMLQLSVRNFTRPVILRQVKGVNCRYAFVKRGSFFSNDHRLNRIYAVCEETLSACAGDVLMDCPWRERAFWVNDLLVTNLATLHCFGTTELHRHCLELAFSQSHPSGLIPAVVPTPRMEEHCDYVFAPTNLYMILILKDYWLFSGDGDTVRHHLPDVERILSAIWQLADEDGILRTSGVTAEWNFYDWSFEENHYGCNGAAESMLSSLFIIAAKTFEEVAEALGYGFDRAELLRRRTLTAQHLEPRFTAPGTGLLEDEVTDLARNRPVKIFTQLAHALWLLTGEATPGCRAACEAALTDERLLMPDYYLHYFWFQAARLAHCEKAGLERIRRYWGRCIDTGSPTLYEAGIHSFGKRAMDGSGSLCHGFGTIPVAFVHEVILGVRALKPGFAEFSFAPDLLDLGFAEGRIPTPGGCIQVRVTPEASELVVPIGCCAICPDGVHLAPGRYTVLHNNKGSLQK